MKLDFSLQSAEERNEYVKKLLEEIPPEKLTHKYLEILGDYIIFAMDKKEKKEKKILTDNRLVTVNKRETSFQGLAEQFETEDVIYSMITNDKNIIFTPKISITQEDLDKIPPLRELVDAIAIVEKQLDCATGKKKFLLKKQLIQMHQDKYVIRNAYYKPIFFTSATTHFSQMSFDNKITVTLQGDIKDCGLLSFFNPKHISALLCNYSKLKESSWGKFWTDAYFIMEDLDNLVEITLKEDFPLYYDLLIYKIDGKPNKDIQALLQKKHNITYTVEYISSLWRNKIPKLLAKKAEDEYLTWYYTVKEKGKWKKCTRCGCTKLASNRFFSKNKGSKDGFYSICKSCRNKKKEGK